MAPRRASNSTASYPPQSINIRGSGGPHVVVVGNVTKGTTVEDIQLTFEPFGPVETVRERAPPSLNYPSLSFEVSFFRRDDANAACASLNGCLADGRVLSVALRSHDLGLAQNAFSGQASAAVRDRLNSDGRLEPGPGPVPRKRDPEPLARGSPVSNKNHNKRPTTAAVPAVPPAQPKPKPTQPAKPAASLQKRMGMGESPAEKKARAVKKAAKATKVGKLSTTPSLKSRITFPLSERIGSGASSSDPKKREKLPPAKKAKKAASQAAAAKGTPGKSARKRANKQAKVSTTGADGMDLD